MVYSKVLNENKEFKGILPIAINYVSFNHCSPCIILGMKHYKLYIYAKYERIHKNQELFVNMHDALSRM